MRIETRATCLALAGALAATVLVNTSLRGQGRQGGDQAPKKEELSETYRGSQRNNVEYQKVPPFKAFDNLYYVGPGFVSVWLLTTSDGGILIDAAQEPYVDHVIDSIKKVGFDLKNIKYILMSHGHLDHFGGIARIQALSGAHVLGLEEDWQAVEAAAKTPPKGDGPATQFPKRDMVIKEGDTLTLGNSTLKFYKMPGHTAGSVSAEFTVFDNGKPYKAFMFGGPGPRGGVDGGEQFLLSARRLSEFQGVQVAVQVHSWLNDYPYPNGGLLERAQKLAQRKPGDPNPFVDTVSWNEWVKKVQDGARANLEKEKAKAPAK